MTIDGYYAAPHRSQYAATESKRTHASGCTWTSGANGANNANARKLAGDDVLAKVAPREETSPGMPGWSLEDLDLAMTRLSVPFGVGQGGWAGVRSAHASGLNLVLQGDSDQFGNGTCSGAFDGNHAIGVHPATDGSRWWINDPICSSGRWEEEAVLHRYAAKLSAAILYGVFTTKVPKPAVRYRLHLAPHAMVRIATLTRTGEIDGWTASRWGDAASSASASKPVLRKGTHHGSAMTTLVRTGKYKGKHLGLGSGVTVEEVV